jgi:hypothetical protein
VAALGAWYSYSISRAAATRQIVAAFVATGTALGTASECFIFANQLEDDRFYDLLGNRPLAFDFSNPAEDHLRRCLQSGALAKHLTAEDALTVRQIIFAKLNSFQELYRSVAQSEGYPDTLCQEVRTGFQSGPQDLIRRIRSHTPRPALGQNIERDLNFVIQAADGRLCQS